MSLDLALMIFDRIVVRGTFAGRYLGLDDQGDVIGKRTTEGAPNGRRRGRVLRPGRVRRRPRGRRRRRGVSEADHAPHLHDALIDDVRSEVPQKSSAVLLLASPEHVGAMVDAFDGSDGRLVRHHLSPEEAQALESAVAGRPPAAAS
jgi:hypothetical protein